MGKGSSQRILQDSILRVPIAQGKRFPDLTTELTEEEKTAKGNGSTMNRSNEDRELENLSSEIVDGEEQVVLDDATATEDNGAEQDNVLRLI